MIRTETGGASTGLPPGFKDHEALVAGMLQLGVDTFAQGKGVSLDSTGYNTALVRRYTLFEDRAEIVQNIVSALHTQVTRILPTTQIEHRFGYRILWNYDVLIGLDPREFEDDSLQVDPFGGDTLDLPAAGLYPT
jgi:hypothetical protein